MINRIVLQASLLLLLVSVCSAHALAEPAAAANTANGAVVAAAEKFLATLDDGQRARVVFDFKDQEQRKRWSNLPSGIFQRAG